MNYNTQVIIGCIFFFLMTTYGKCIFNQIFFNKSESLDTTWTITTLYFFLGAYLLFTKHLMSDDGTVMKEYIRGMIFVVGFHIIQRSINSILDKAGKTRIKYKELEIAHNSFVEKGDNDVR